MIKAMANLRGNRVLVLGLSFGNLDKFKAEPLDTYILVDGKDFGLGVDILLLSGETEDQMVKALNLENAQITDLRHILP